jgi:fatty-acyl-CoA synthase
MKYLLVPFIFLKALYFSGFNLMAVLYLAAQLQPKNIAIDDTISEINYLDLYKRATNFGLFFYKKYTNVTGIKIGILAKNHIDLVSILFGTSPLGCHIFLLNTSISNLQLQDLAQQHDFDLLLYDDDLADLTQGINSERMAFSNISFSNKNIEKHIRLPKKRTIFTLLTSGTTGAFKTASRRPSLLNFLAPFLALLTQLKLYKYRSVFVAIPIFHGFGMAALILSVVLGVKIQLMPRFDTKKAVLLIKKQQIAVITLVPSILQKLLNEGEQHLESLRCIVSGGAPLSANLVKTVTQTLDCQLFSLYGTSEAGFCILAKPKHLEKLPTTIGKPIIGVKTLILNDKNQSIADDQIGRLCIKTRWSIIEKITKNWVETGDLAYKNAENYYFLSGRIDDMMVIGGENVYPITIENALLEQPDIAEAVVIAQSDTIAGQRPKAFVILSNKPASAGKNMPTEADLLLFLQTRLARFQMPKNIVFVTDFCYTAIGKVDKRKLISDFPNAQNDSTP